MNEKTIFESQDKKIIALTEKVDTYKDSIEVLHDRVADLNYFTLNGNESATTYIESLNMTVPEVEDMVSDAIYVQNGEDGGNPLIPLKGVDGNMKVNKLKFINHRWIQADFSDGTYWGEMLIEYFFDENNNLKLTTLGSTLYPQ